MSCNVASKLKQFPRHTLRVTGGEVTAGAPWCQPREGLLAPRLQPAVHPCSCPPVAWWPRAPRPRPWSSRRPSSLEGGTLSWGVVAIWGTTKMQMFWLLICAACCLSAPAPALYFSWRANMLWSPLMMALVMPSPCARRPPRAVARPP